MQIPQVNAATVITEPFVLNIALTGLLLSFLPPNLLSLLQVTDINPED